MGDRPRRFADEDPRFQAFQRAVLAADRAHRAGRKARAEAFEAEAERARAGLTRAVREHEHGAAPRPGRRPT